MISPEIAAKIDRLIALHEQGIFTEREFALQLGGMISSDNLEVVLNRAPFLDRDLIKHAVLLDNQRTVDGDGLSPEGSPFCGNDAFFSGYYHRVADALLLEQIHSKRALVYLVALPSFEPEWSLQLFEIAPAEFILNVAVSESQIYDSRREEFEETKVRRHSIGLATQIADAVCEIWKTILFRVRHSDLTRRGRDGLSYHFGFLQGHYLAGRAWSPESNTVIGRVVELSELLRQYAERTDSENIGDISEIQQAVDSLSGLSE